MILCSVVLPWRVKQANFLDVGINVGFLLIIFLGALFTDTANKPLIAIMLLVIFSSMLLLLICVAFYCLITFLQRRGKPYVFFLCHHKEGGGCFARLLKMRLVKHPQVTRQVFLDSDNLQDLSVLFSVVATRIDTLVVLCTRSILLRPWCVGEMTTARVHSLDVILLSFPDFQWPSETFIADVSPHMEGIESLVPYGIGVDMVQATLRWLPSLPQLLLPQHTTLACVDTVVAKLVHRRGGRSEFVSVPGIVLENSHESDDLQSILPKPCAATGLAYRVESLSDGAAPVGCQVVSIVDTSNVEVVCTALIIKELLKSHFPLMTKVPHVLGADEHLPEGVHTVLVICSSGCFHQTCFLRHVVEADARGAVTLPILAEASFRVPSDWHTEFQELPQCAEFKVDDLPVIMGRIFETIAIGVRSQDSEEVLNLCATTIASRLNAGPNRDLGPISERQLQILQIRRPARRIRMMSSGPHREKELHTRGQARCKVVVQPRLPYNMWSKQMSSVCANSRPMLSKKCGRKRMASVRGLLTHHL